MPKYTPQPAAKIDFTKILQEKSPQVFETLKEKNLSGKRKDTQAISLGTMMIIEEVVNTLVQSNQDISNAINNVSQELLELQDRLDNIANNI